MTRRTIYHYQVIMVLMEGGKGLNGKAEGEGLDLFVDYHVKVSKLGQGCYLGPLLFSWSCCYFFPCFVRVLGPR